MPCYVGLDASKRTTKICILDKFGSVVREGEAATEPSAIAAFLRGDRLRYARIGMEAWSMAPWLYQGLVRERLPIICIEARHASGILKGRVNKTDRNDARGIAEMMRAGLYRTVHIKSDEARQLKVLLSTRRLLVQKIKDVEGAIRGFLLGAGLKLAPKRRGTFEQRVLALLRRHEFLAGVIRQLLAVRSVMVREFTDLDRRVVTITERDPICQRLMTVPGVGPQTAILYRTSIDDPHRFTRSTSVGAHFGLVPRIRQSGESERRGRITRSGDAEVRAALFIAARGMFSPGRKPTAISEWGKRVAARRGSKLAMVAMARRLACTLHRMWVTGSDFCGEPQAI